MKSAAEVLEELKISLKKEEKVKKGTKNIEYNYAYSWTATSCEIPAKRDEILLIINNDVKWNQIHPSFCRNTLSDPKMKQLGITEIKELGVIRFQPPDSKPITFNVQERKNMAVAFVLNSPPLFSNGKFEFEFNCELSPDKKNFTIFSVQLSYNHEETIQEICKQAPDKLVEEIVKGVFKKHLNQQLNEAKKLQEINLGEDAEFEEGAEFKVSAFNR